MRRLFSVRQSRRASRTNVNQAESLEIRVLPAGTVGIKLSGGNVTITGDGKDNQIAVTVNTDTGTVEVTPLGTTKLKFDGETTGEPVVLEDVAGVGKLTVNMKGGDDELFLNVVGGGGFVVEGDASVDMGSGNDVLVATVDTDTLLTFKKNLTIKGGSGKDSVLLGNADDIDDVFGGIDVDFDEADQNVVVKGKFSLSTSSGDDTVGIVGLSVAKDATFDSGTSDGDVMGLTNVSVGGKSSFKLIDDLLVTNSAFDGSVKVTGGGGNDRVVVDGVSFGGKIDVNLGSGNDQLAVGVVVFDPDLSHKIDGGSGKDDIVSGTDFDDDDVKKGFPVKGFEDDNADGEEIADDILAKIIAAFVD